MELLYWLLEEGDSEDRESSKILPELYLWRDINVIIKGFMMSNYVIGKLFIKKPKILCLTKFSSQSEISCGLFSLDAKAMEKSSAQVV
eukprot:bmy_02341T0